MEVAQPVEDVVDLRIEVFGAEAFRLHAQDANALHRIETVARALQRQVGVGALEQRLEAVEQGEALPRAELDRRRLAAELVDRHAQLRLAHLLCRGTALLGCLFSSGPRQMNDVNTGICQLLSRRATHAHAQ